MSKLQQFSKSCLVSNSLAQLSEPPAILHQDHVLLSMILSMPKSTTGPCAFSASKMALWDEIASVVPEPAVLRRALFAAAHVPNSTPKYSEIVCEFAFQSSKDKLNPEKLRVLLENLAFINAKVFDTDRVLLEDLLKLEHRRGHPLGIILIPANSICKDCGGSLQLRNDRPTSLVIYTDDMGTIPATAYRKYCKNSHKGCSFTQHYGFHCFNSDEKSGMVADSNWAELPYFISTSKTGFATAFLQKFDAELLIGQISYKQKADIYNFYHKYEKVQKKKPCTEEDQMEELFEDQSSR